MAESGDYFFFVFSVFLLIFFTLRAEELFESVCFAGCLSDNGFNIIMACCGKNFRFGLPASIAYICYRAVFFAGCGNSAVFLPVVAGCILAVFVFVVSALASIIILSVLFTFGFDIPSGIVLQIMSFSCINRPNGEVAFYI